MNPKNSEDYAYTFKEGPAWQRETLKWFLLNCGMLKTYSQKKSGAIWEDERIPIENLRNDWGLTAFPDPSDNSCAVTDTVFGRKLRFCSYDSSERKDWEDAINYQSNRFKDPRCEDWNYGTH